MKKKKHSDEYYIDPKKFSDEEKGTFYKKQISYINQIKDLERNINLYKNFIRNWYETYEIRDFQENNILIKKSQKKTQFIRSCPNNNCKGFLNEDYKCTLCELEVCKKCHCEIQENHQCKQEDIDTAKLLMKDSKSCPTCHTMIFKISGCDQMWCTQCHTAFSWNTGEIERTIHNPHYYEWMRQNRNFVPRNVNDLPCGGLITLRELIHLKKDKKFIIETILKDDEYHSAIVYRFHMFIQHVNLVENRKYNFNEEFENIKSIKRRINYLLNKISDNDYKKILQKNEKNKKIKESIQMILNMFYNASVDIFHNLVENKNVKESIDEVTELILYTNKSFKRLSYEYNRSMPFIYFKNLKDEYSKKYQNNQYNIFKLYHQNKYEHKN